MLIIFYVYLCVCQLHEFAAFFDTFDYRQHTEINKLRIEIWIKVCLIEK